MNRGGSGRRDLSALFHPASVAVIGATAEAGHIRGRITGVLVEAMASPGLEFILGVSRDDTFGPMLLLGHGGVDAGLMADRVLTPLLVGETEAMRLIDRLDRGRMMGARRGRPARDRAALARLVAALGRLAWDFRERIAEIDLNPVIVGAEGEGVAVVDALMVQEARER